MAPEATNEDLLYVSDFYGVHVFSYPKGTHVGDLAGFAEPQGLCTDRAGDIFVTDNVAQDVVEFSHGGTNPIAILHDQYVEFNPYDCSVDPTTGNLAVASEDNTWVVIFPHAKQNPTAYSDAYAIMLFCAYDDKGNLYVDDVIHQRKSYIGVLLKGTTTFKNFLLASRIGAPASLQFDGQRVAVDDARSNIIYQLRFSNLKATIIGTTPLTGAKHVQQYWIRKKKVIGPDLYGAVYFWQYPAGGSPIRSIPGFTDTHGSTVSVGP